MTVYIAGKITGNDRYKDQFRLAEASLSALGYRVINPAALPAGLNPANYMSICVPMLLAADAVYFIPGWETSGGANIEHDLAEYCGKQILGDFGV